MSGLDSFLRGFALFIGRLAVAFIFLFNAYGHITNFAGTLKFMSSQVNYPENVLRMLLIAAIVLMVVGGLSMVFGLFTRFGALCLILFLIGVTPQMHAFWKGGAEQAMQLNEFIKNLAIFGGLLSYMAWGAGAWSIDFVRFAGKK
jgi:putative oxidoreductase